MSVKINKQQQIRYKNDYHCYYYHLLFYFGAMHVYTGDVLWMNVNII